MIEWGAIALAGAEELGKGVLAYIGGKAFAEIAGFPDDQDIENLLRKAVEEIKACVRYETRKALDSRFM